MVGGFWMFGWLVAVWPVRVHTSWVAICWRTAAVALAAAPPRLTVAVVPSTVTSRSLVRGGNAVTAGGVGLPWLWSHSACGLFSSALTRLPTSEFGEVPVGTNTASGTSTWPVESKKYRSCAR